MNDAVLEKVTLKWGASEDHQETQGLLSPVDFAEIQGMVVRGYGNLPAACFTLLKITDARQARQALRSLQSDLTFAEERPVERALNLAWTHHGLQQIGLDEDVRNQFSNEFLAGMTTEHKRRILGDVGSNAPEYWDWGGPKNPDIDLLLMCYAQDQASLDSFYHPLMSRLNSAGIDTLLRLDTTSLPDTKEHFGFKDGIAQPFVKEFDRKGRQVSQPVPLGEILLGYPNGYERYTQRPLVSASEDPQNLLPPDTEGTPARDLGKNGTYLVFRQLAQNVPAFWQFMQAQTDDADAAIRLASKMVGRWPSGAPLVLAAETDDPNMADKDAFAYHDADALGHKCPLGAHIRRTHPRDSLQPQPGSEKSVAFSNRHRLLRRGRAFGAPFLPSLNPRDFLQQLAQGDADGTSESRGLHFICINANIGRQFEFVQHTWANNPTFNGLYHDPDPIIGSRSAYGLPQDQFTRQAEPVRCQFKGMPEFVSVRGGGYFFVPSRSAHKYILTAGE